MYLYLRINLIKLYEIFNDFQISDIQGHKREQMSYSQTSKRNLNGEKKSIDNLLFNSNPTISSKLWQRRAFGKYHSFYARSTWAINFHSLQPGEAL